VAGETAPLLFTAFGNRYWSQGGDSQRRRLPVMILYLPRCHRTRIGHRQAWAAGLVLLGLILIINILARTILSRGIAVAEVMNMQASSKPGLSVNIVTTTGSVIHGRGRQRWRLRMTISKVNFYYGSKQILFDINLGIADKRVTAADRPIGVRQNRRC